MRRAHFTSALVSLTLLVGSASWAIALEGFDAERLAVEREHDLAARQSRQAQDAVTHAEAAVVEARAKLDQFLAEHFEDLEQAETPTSRHGSRTGAAPTTIPSATAAQLNRQIEELTARRDLLLVRLLPAHPEVLTIEGQIAAAAAKLTALAVPAKGGDASSGDAHNQRLFAALSAAHKQHQAAARQYSALQERLRAAEQEFREAVAEAKRAGQRLADFDRPASPDEPKSLTSASPSVPPALSAPRRAAGPAETPSSRGEGSQPLALAALLIALAVAALAAVKLARSNSDSIFASVEDVAAALALPVVGIIPAAEVPGAASVSPARLVRPMVVAGQVFLATVLFALIAYVVQNPASFWQACADPLEGLGRVASYFRDR